VTYHAPQMKNSRNIIIESLTRMDVFIVYGLTLYEVSHFKQARRVPGVLFATFEHPIQMFNPFAKWFSDWTFHPERASVLYACCV
jgi:hypothetical protein